MNAINVQILTCVHAVFENKDKIVIVMEYASRGDLFDYISERKVSEREARHIFRQVVSAVHYCHRVNLLPDYCTPSTHHVYTSSLILTPYTICTVSLNNFFFTL